MSAKDESFAQRGTLTRRFARTTRSISSFALLCGAALAISVILPSPWTILRDPNTPKFAFGRSRDDLLLGKDPAEEWKDDLWPIREQTPWDISTDFPYPRKLEYDVQEGTWLRLDVHPTSGDIVFDMVGDIYCLPGAEALLRRDKESDAVPFNARPVLQGVPHDADPRFSPEGDRLLFRSDAGLGVDNIWVMEWKGCDAMDLTRPELHDICKTKDAEEDLLAQGVAEDAQRKRNRLLREGRLGALRVTNETYVPVRDARFHPSGDRVVAGKWYTPHGSGMCASEGWEYPVPSLADLRAALHLHLHLHHPLHSTQNPISSGSGRVLAGRNLPPGRTLEEYGMSKVGPEQLLWHGADAVIYAKNVADEWLFTYSKDVHKGIYAIFEKNLTTGVTETLVDAFPGGASRPEVSRDGRTLAFVRRVRDKEALVFKDLLTGSIHNIWHGLTNDLSTVTAPMGTYPSFAFTPSDDAVVIWAAGQIYLVPLSTNSRGEKIASSTTPPKPIPFRARIEKRLAETRRASTDLVGLETMDKQRVTAFRDLRVDDGARRVVFEAAGSTYWHEMGKKRARRVPALDLKAPYYSASFVPGTSFVIHARWSDLEFSSFELADLETGKAFAIEGLPLGRYFSPILSGQSGLTRTVAFLKSSGTYLTGDILATAQPGLYLGQIVVPQDPLASQSLQIKNIRFVPSDINVEERVNMRFIEGDTKLLVQQTARAFIIDLGGKQDLFGKYPGTTLAEGKTAAEFAVSTRTRQRGKIEVDNAAFVDFFNIYIAPGKSAKRGEPLWSRPGNATKGLARVSLDGGHDVTWSPDGSKLFWLLGSSLYSLEISALHKCASAIKEDQVTFGISCVSSLVHSEEIIVEYDTDIARLKKDAAHEWLLKGYPDSADETVYVDGVLITNATILTMESGNLEQDIIQNGSMYIQGGVIQHVAGPQDTAATPSPGVTVIDAQGGFVVPGYIDMHAHWYGCDDRYPAKSWEMQTLLAYGVTTVNNPGSMTVYTFIERARIESGQMLGPRIFSSGVPIYGGHMAFEHQDIVDMDTATSALKRVKEEGGVAAISYKNYNLVSRASRQRLLKVARNISMLALPEGGMNYDWDVTFVVDGMTTIEHAFPVGRLYKDVTMLYALSGTASTPTHTVNYPGAEGEQLVWATEDLPNNSKLRKFTRHDILQGLTETTSRPKNSFSLYNTSASIAEMVAMGHRTHIGAHGENPLGLNYHAEMGFAAAGGLSNYQVLQAATSSAAQTLGLFNSIGSLSPGKLADFLIYPPGVGLLEGEIGSKTRLLTHVARGGRIWDADTMEEVWPSKGRKQDTPIINAE